MTSKAEAAQAWAWAWARGRLYAAERATRPPCRWVSPYGLAEAKTRVCVWGDCARAGGVRQGRGLLAVTTSFDRLMRWEALRGLHQLRYERVISFLLALAGDRAAALVLLARTGDEEFNNDDE